MTATSESINNKAAAAPAGAGIDPPSGRPAQSAGAALRPRAARTLARWLGGFFLIALVVMANVVAWRITHPAVQALGFQGQIAGFAYNAYQRWQSPLERNYPSTAEIDSDLKAVAGSTRRIRTYSSSELLELPSLAAKYDLRVTAGVWLDRRLDNNEREISAAADAANSQPNVERIIAGNETLLRDELGVRQLIGYLRALRSQTRVPVSTAEPWHVWLRYPELADAVDFITVHLLPYWEGVPYETGVDYALQRLDQVRRAHPNKHIVIGEIGWPSNGDRFDGARTSSAIQAQFIREFLARTDGMHLDYFLMEWVDQPWKIANEGRVGPYWGLLHADRTAKFGMVGPIETDPYWRLKAGVASLVAFVPMLLFVLRFSHLKLASRLSFAALIQACASVLVWLVSMPLQFYLRPVDWIALIVLVPTLLAMLAIMLVNGFEFVEMYWSGNLRRGFAPRPLPTGAREPFVSVHLACCNEPPEMVIATIDSLARLDYQDFEVLVVDNNTKDPALWEPVQARCAELGERFRFFHLPAWPGFKAGALNFALEQTDLRTEVIGVVDADYVVKPHWLRALTGYFDDPTVGVVQSPQAHRGWAGQLWKRMMNFEYDGFFRIGMHHRNERDAIIQHGTMTLIKAEALLEHGRWSEWCICEDAELGLRLMKRGLSTIYVDRVMGEGLTPDDFAAFRKQRRRWAFGAMQILRAHWRSLLGGDGRLTGAQRYHFLTGWFSWFGDALHLLFTFAAMFWTVGIIASPYHFTLPIMLFMVPLFAFFAGKALMGPLLYRRRVPCSWGETIGAALAGMALSHPIALGVFAGLTGRKGVFEITRKGAARPLGGRWACVREEFGMFAALMTCLAGMAIARKSDHVESAMWIGMLVLQSVPYAAALICNALAGLPERKQAPRAEPDGAIDNVVVLDPRLQADNTGWAGAPARRAIVEVDVLRTGTNS